MRALLSGGDRRSLAQASRVYERVLADRGLVADLAALAMDADVLVSMRALDLLEKVAHVHPEWVAPHKRLFISALADSDRWEIHLQIVRALPLFEWSAAERRRAIEVLRRDVDYPQTFVRAWALDSLSILAMTDRSLAPLVRRHVKRFDASGSKALAARARHVKGRLSPRATAKTARR
jgi:hypothetical protein